jgi:two-component system OmpR family response regulator
MGGRRVLVVEDHEATRNLLRALFRRVGWEVSAAATVADALALLAQPPPPDGLVLDLMLPDGDGVVVLRKVRTDGLPTRVAVCTGTHDPARIAALRALAAAAFFPKPIDFAAVCRALA